jgi:hypothetical protein
MNRYFKKPVAVLAALFFATLLTIILALVQVVQIPLGALPEDSRHLGSGPIKGIPLAATV